MLDYAIAKREGGVYLRLSRYESRKHSTSIGEIKAKVIHRLRTAPRQEPGIVGGTFGGIYGRMIR